MRRRLMIDELGQGIISQTLRGTIRYHGPARLRAECCRAMPGNRSPDTPWKFCFYPQCIGETYWLPCGCCDY